MKKFNIILSAALLVSLAACDDDSDLGKMQINEELPRIATDCATIAPGDAYASAPWDLEKLTEGGVESLNLAVTTATKGLPENAIISYGTEFSATEDFANPVFKDLSDGSISVTDLDDIFRKLFGMGPKPHTMYIRTEAMVHIGTQISIAGTGNECWQIEKAVELTPVPKPMEEKYYFLSDVTNWDLDPDKSIEMSHMEGADIDIYQYPYFWIVLDCTADKTYCKIAPESAVESGNWDNVLGVAKEEVMTSGTLAVGNSGAFIIEGPGRYIFRFNAMESTFTVLPATDALYTPGDGLNNWNPETAFPLTTSDYVNYRGFSYLGSGGFKLIVQPNWDGPGDYGSGSQEGWIKWGGSDIVPPVTDFAFLNVSTGSWKIDYTAVSSVSICGGLTNDWAGDIPMTHDASWQKWSVVADFPANKLDFKIRANNGWDINYGLKSGSSTILEFGGDNITVPAAGKYEIVADFSKAPFTVSVTPK